MSAFVRIGPYPLPHLQTSANVTKYAVNSDWWTFSNYQMSASDCCWHWQDTQSWLQAVSGCLYLERLGLHCCELRFIQLVTLSLFLSLSTVLHCYTLWTSVFAKTSPPPSSAFVCIGPYPLPPLLGRSLWMTPSLLSMTLCLAFKCRVPTGAEQS